MMRVAPREVRPSARRAGAVAACRGKRGARISNIALAAAVSWRRAETGCRSALADAASVVRQKSTSRLSCPCRLAQRGSTRRRCRDTGDSGNQFRSCRTRQLRCSRSPCSKSRRSWSYRLSQKCHLSPSYRLSRKCHLSLSYHLSRKCHLSLSYHLSRKFRPQFACHPSLSYRRPKRCRRLRSCRPQFACLRLRSYHQGSRQFLQCHSSMTFHRSSEQRMCLQPQSCQQ